MISFEKLFTDHAIKAVEALYGQIVPESLIQVQKTRKDFSGVLLKEFRQTPERDKESSFDPVQKT